MQITGTRLGDILCHREQRYVGAQLTFHYDRKQIILEQTEVAKGLAGRYVEIFDHFDKPLEVRWQGYVLPFRVFNKDQIVRPGEVVENKRLRHALSVVRAKQEKKLEVRIMTTSYGRNTPHLYRVGPAPRADRKDSYLGRCAHFCNSFVNASSFCNHTSVPVGVPRISP